MIGAVVVFASEDEGAEAAYHVETDDRDPDRPDGDRDRSDGHRADGDDAARDDRARGGGAAWAIPSPGRPRIERMWPLRRSRRRGVRGRSVPNLDEALEGKDAEFVHQSIVEPNAEVAEGYTAGVMPSFQQLSERPGERPGRVPDLYVEDTSPERPGKGASIPARGCTTQRRGRDLNPRRTFQPVRDFQSRSLDRSDTSPRWHSVEAAQRREGFNPRRACTLNGFRDRPVRPLRHLL